MREKLEIGDGKEEGTLYLGSKGRGEENFGKGKGVSALDTVEWIRRNSVLTYTEKKSRTHSSNFVQKRPGRVNVLSRLTLFLSYFEPFSYVSKSASPPSENGNRGRRFDRSWRSQDLSSASLHVCNGTSLLFTLSTPSLLLPAILTKRPDSELHHDIDNSYSFLSSQACQVIIHNETSLTKHKGKD